MARQKRFLVIGLGKFGSQVAATLYEEGHEVIALDSDPDRVQRAADFCTEALVQDATDHEGLAALGPEEMDAAVVSTGSDTGKSILITLYLNELGVKKVVAKAINQDHRKILAKVGASDIIEPEKSMAVRVAQTLSRPNMIDFFPLEKGYSLLEIAPPRSFRGHTLADINLRARFNVFVIAVKEFVPDNFVMLPPADFRIKDSDLLILVGHQADIMRVSGLE